MRTIVSLAFMMLAFSPLASAQDLPGVNSPVKKTSVKEVKDARYKQLVEFSAMIKKIRKDNDLLVGDSTGQVRVDINEMPFPLKVNESIRIIGRVDRDWGVEVYATQIDFGQGLVTVPRGRDD